MGIKVSSKLTILIIDDESESQEALFRLYKKEANFLVRDPADLDDSTLRAADLILVDLNLQYWLRPDRNLISHGSEDRSGEGVSLQWLHPANGLALAGLLREYLKDASRTVGFALRSGALQTISVSPEEPRLHTTARLHNLEWVFSKDVPTSGEVVTQIVDLAKAIQALPQEWSLASRFQTRSRVAGLLGLTARAAWYHVAIRDVEYCRPPVTELSLKNHGLIFLRWMIQRILPYPCFLYDSHWVAARLGITHSCFNDALGKGLREVLSTVTYSGIAEGFLGDRWWRAGVEQLLWELRDGNALTQEQLRIKLGNSIGISLVKCETDDPIICVDENYATLPEAYAPEEVIMIQPDDWPIFASQAWTTKELVKSSNRLSALVVDEEWDSEADESFTVTQEDEGRE